MNFDDDKAIQINPELITFHPIVVDGVDVLKIAMHTPNLGTFVLPATVVQAEHLGDSLQSYVDQVGVNHMIRESNAERRG
jgi:hypothetical protein